MSASEVRASLEVLGRQAKKLNAITDEANDTVRLVEQFLEECSLGLYTSVHCMDDGNEDGPTDSTFLEYRRFPNHGKYRLVVTNTEPAHKVANSTILHMCPWSECSRATKLETFPHLPKLLAAMAQGAQTRVEADESRTRSVIDTVQGIIRPKQKK